MSGLHGYDDAIRGRIDLMSDVSRMGDFIRQEIDDIMRRGDKIAARRHVIVRGLDPDDVVGKSTIAASRILAAAEKETLQEAPLVYISPGVLDRLEDFSTVVPDRYVLPFAEPMLLWFADPIKGDVFSSSEGEATHIPSRAMLVRPFEKKLLYMAYTTGPDLVATLGQNEGTGDYTTLRYIPDVLGEITFGSQAPKKWQYAQYAARMLNAMAARDVRMLEDETPTRHVRKQAKRAGITAGGDVHVIYLPKEKKPGSRVVPDDPAGDGSTSKRRHRVRAHWRRQPYGPKGAGQWRWKRVEAHERGKGAMLEGETVYTTR